MNAQKETTAAVKMFRCPACFQEHETTSCARNCCPVEFFYICEECGEEFDNISLAKKCCTKWFCEECGEEYEGKTAANRCCK